MPTKLSGATELRLALRKFAPDLGKETQKEMGRALRTITSKAKGYLPSNSEMLSGWTSETSSEDTAKYRPFPKYDQGIAKRGIKYFTTPSKPNRNGWVSLARIENQSAGGAIYETAGRKNPTGAPVFQRTKFTPANYREDGKGFNKSLNPNAGKQFLDRANQLGKLMNAREKGKAGRATRKLTGRVIFRAWAEDQGKANSAILKAIDNSSVRFNERTRGNNG